MLTAPYGRGSVSRLSIIYRLKSRDHRERF